MNILDESNLKSKYTKLVTNPDIPSHSHTFFEFSICLKGAFDNRINGRHYDTTKGTIVLLRPEDEHRIMSYKSHLSRDVYIMPNKLKLICDSISPRLYSQLAKEPLVVHFKVSDFDIKTLENKLAIFSKPHQSTTLLKIAHTNIVTEILMMWKQYQSTQMDKYPEWLSTLIRDINTEEALTMNIADVIKNTSYSHEYICREFKKHLGVTLREYMADIKFSYACELLQESVMNVSQIARTLNYGATSNFVLAFTKRFGIPPTTWKKINKESENNNKASQ